VTLRPQRTSVSLESSILSLESEPELASDSIGVVWRCLRSSASRNLRSRNSSHRGDCSDGEWCESVVGGVICLLLSC
jgi:hypothetical protein